MNDMKLSIETSDELALHKLTFLNQYEDLENILKPYFSPNSPYKNIDKLDNRGCTALHIAVMKGHLECVKILIKAGASCIIKNSEGWTLTNEATSLGNRDILELVLTKKTDQMKVIMDKNSPTKHFKNKDNKSFYLEINWGVQTWIPLVGSFCPSDQYKIYKKDDWFRIDTTLAGFDNMKWKRGKISYLFSINKEKGPFIAIIDHDKKIYQMVEYSDNQESDKLSPNKKEEETIVDPEMIYNQINSLLNSPFTYTNVRTSHIKFERETSGFWPFSSSSKIEKIGEYNCEVWKMDNINIRSRTRSEHLKVNPNSKIIEEKEDEPLPSDQSQLTLVNESSTPKEEDLDKLGEQIQSELEELQKYCPSLPPPPPSSVTIDQYFDPNSSSHIHLGRPIIKKEWKHSMKATLWMAKTKESFENSSDSNLPTGNSEEPTFPLNIGHIMPFLEVASLSSNQLVDKLKDFLKYSLPPGFPIQLQIPIIPMVSVKVGFTGYKKWSPEFEDSLGPGWFEIPKDYEEGIVFDNLKAGLGSGSDKDVENY